MKTLKSLIGKALVAGSLATVVAGCAAPRGVKVDLLDGTVAVYEGERKGGSLLYCYGDVTLEYDLDTSVTDFPPGTCMLYRDTDGDGLPDVKHRVYTVERKSLDDRSFRDADRLFYRYMPRKPVITAR